MKTILAVILTFSSTFLLAETDAEKIADLEKRVSKLEELVKPIISKQEAEKKQHQLAQKARARMRKDSKIYSNAELREIESLYQVANRKWRSKEGKESLEKLIEKYQSANRTGCALLYLGQMSTGQQQVDYLKKAIKDFSDCCYGDGVQVGAYARFILAQVYLKQGKKEQAEKLFAEIKTDYPDAITHRGQSLMKIIDNERGK